ncbi:retrovirus-related Pol polyprotein from transposon opus [Nephila pilipes]|uniref:Retrovirus-related Pol polyprotein from transposon opus n=1 Tax=Nephila pilipes TaxID=299642 RepID=A0A8X6U7N4_NEPPI|nr:retrovirus-related Pol polyprotein from transposon opus [Nephila pilipes]
MGNSPRFSTPGYPQSNGLVEKFVLGVMGFYRAYIPNYAEISTPLTEVTSLATPNANLPFQVHCDASDYGVGCCLTQQDAEGIYGPIAFATQKFIATQKNWASIEKEACEVLYGLISLTNGFTVPRWRSFLIIILLST